jgi:hypothetical protein
MGWNNTITVKYYEVLSAGVGVSKIPGRPGAAIGFKKVPDIQLGRISGHYLFTGDSRSVFHHEDLKIPDCLGKEALQKVAHFLRSVVDRHDNRIPRVLHDPKI